MKPRSAATQVFYWLLLGGLTAGMFPQAARADWTASGRFQYTDRLYAQSGFTGTTPKAVREADVEVYDVVANTVLAVTATDSNGDFSIFVADGAVRDVGVRVLSSTTQTPVINFSVVDDLNGNAVYSYHDASADELGHNPSTNHNFGTMTMPAAIGDVASTDWSSQIFNALDMCVLTADWIQSVDGARPSPSLTVGWNPTSGSSGSSYSGGSNRLNLSDDDGYDDPNILHEVGHYVEDEFGRSRNIGGSHTISDDDQDPRLAWSEGFATYVSGATLNYHGLPLPNVYIDRDSFNPSGGGGFAYNFESNQNGGSTNEGAVQAALYDLVDDNATADTSIGSDDDPLSGLDSSVWAVLEEMRVRQLPATSMEDFWDLWFELGFGNSADMITTFFAHQIDFFADSSEPDNLRTEANTLTPTYAEHTFYRSIGDTGGDEDWYQFNATAGTYYRIQVNGAANQIFGRPDPELYLLDTDGETVLAYNDDPLDTTLNGNSSNNNMIETVPEILWRAPTGGTYYVYCRHASYERNLGGRYGTYKIRVVTVGSPSPTISDVAYQFMLPGQSYQALITGTEFAVDATVTTSSGDVTVTDTRWIAPEAIVATFAVAGGATTGSFNVTVSNPGAGSDTQNGAFSIDNNARPPIIISEVDLGSDKVELKNVGTVAADLTGWELIGRSTSATQQTFTFPSFTLPPGATVRVSDGTGTDTAVSLFDQGSSFNWPWGNIAGGDISLLDSAGNNVDYKRWIQSYARTQQAPLGNNAAWMQPEMRTPASGHTVSADEDTALARTTIGASAANPTIPVGASGRDNAVDRFEDNDEIRRAPLINFPATISDLAISPRPSANDDDDWFMIAVTAGESVEITAQFGHASGNLELEIYSPGVEAPPFQTSASTSDDETISLTAALTNIFGSGIYRFRVYGNAGATNSYSLIITQPAGQDYFTELFDGGNPSDLANETLMFIPNGSPGHYAACSLDTEIFPVDPAGGTPVILADDDSLMVTPGGGQQVELFGTSYASFFINANGSVTMSSGDGTSNESTNAHFSQPRISGWFDDLDHSLGGTITWKALAESVVVTFEDVPEAGLPANTVSFQIEMFTNGNGIIRLTHLGVLAGDGIAGLSSGPGSTPGDYADSDLSAYGGCLLEDWRVLHFGPGNPPGSGNLEDPEGDDVFNIFEYALGLDPNVRDVDGLPFGGFEDILGQEHATFTYNRLLNNTDLNYFVQYSTDLVIWVTVPDSVVSTSNFVETRKATVLIGAGQIGFVKLVVTD